jgi:membrane protein
MSTKTDQRHHPPEAAKNEATESDHGREAKTPAEVPPRGWWDILVRTKNELGSDNLSIVAAGMAFYCFLAFVPTLGAVISIYALAADPKTVSDNLSALTRVMPPEIMPVINEQISRLVAESQTAGIGAAISLLLALYGGSKAAKALMEGLNIAYDEKEKRGFFRLLLTALLLTLGAVLGAVLAIGLVAVLPVALRNLRLGSVAETLATWLRWPILMGGFMVALGILYRYAPCRDEPKWRWVSWGAALGTGLWVAGSALFSLYVSSFGNYDKSYGSLGALVIFLFWLYLTGYAVLIGAELNSEMERQTFRDTTKGPEQPMGARGAHSADTVGPDASGSSAA